jgi:hypothetical protein
VHLPNILSKSKAQVISLESSNSEVRKELFCDIIFVIPTNKIELGGLKSSFELANYIADRGLSVKIVYLNHDPTGVHSEMAVNKSNAKNLACKLVVVCGSEASEYLTSNESFKFSKSVLFMQGPDHYFESDWSRSLKFINMLEKSDLTFTLSNKGEGSGTLKLDYLKSSLFKSDNEETLSLLNEDTFNRDKLIVEE